MILNHIDGGKAFDFGRTSADYARFRDIYPADMYEKLINLGVGKEGQKILDLGSGTAVLPMNMYRTGAHFTATDISPAQVRAGEELAAERGMDIDFKVCPAENTGFEDNSFDVVTAVQCFHYFDPERVADEIYRVLKPGGLFCKIFMDWLPARDPSIREMEELILKYNPTWTGAGFDKYRYTYPEWAEGRFRIHTIHNYDTKLSFSKEAWLGRVRSSRGVGASLSPELISAFERDYRTLLQKSDKPLSLQHEIHIELYQSEKI